MPIELVRCYLVTPDIRLYILFVGALRLWLWHCIGGTVALGAARRVGR